MKFDKKQDKGSLISIPDPVTIPSYYGLYKWYSTRPQDSVGSARDHVLC